MKHETLNDQSDLNRINLKSIKRSQFKIKK